MSKKAASVPVAGARRQAQNLPYEREHSSAETPEEPPPYSSSSSRSAPIITSQPSRPNIPGIPDVDFSAYRAASGELSKDQSTITVASPMLQNPNTLAIFLRDQAALPPRPEIRIKGRNAHQVHFDIRINMMAYFLPPNGTSSLSYLKATSSAGTKRSDGQEDIPRTVANAYSAETTKKRLILTRSSSNWDVECLEGRLRYLIADLKYKGDVSIEFTTCHGCVVVKPPAGSGFGAVWSGITGAFAEAKKFEVEVVWPYANVQRDGDGRVCNFVDEDRWWMDWKKAITYAVLNRHKGFVGADTWIEAEMDIASTKKPKEDWGQGF